MSTDHSIIGPNSCVHSNHTGPHKITNAAGWILLAKRLGKLRVVAEMGAGRYGVARVTVSGRNALWIWMPRMHGDKL